MSKKIKAAPAPWMKEYRESEDPRGYAGWHIKKGEYPHTPIAVLCEPMGGRKVNGRSPYQTANANLIQAAPLLLEECKAFVAKVEAGLAKSTETYRRMKSVIALAEGATS